MRNAHRVACTGSLLLLCLRCLCRCQQERRFLWQSFREARHDISLRFEFATTERLRNAVTLGCRALHFSGHGSPTYLSFEDGSGLCHVVTVDKLRELLAAGSADSSEMGKVRPTVHRVVCLQHRDTGCPV